MTRKKGKMVLIETDMVIYTIRKKAHESPSKFIQLFKALVDTVNAHGVRD